RTDPGTGWPAAGVPAGGGGGPRPRPPLHRRGLVGRPGLGPGRGPEQEGGRAGGGPAGPVGAGAGRGGRRRPARRGAGPLQLLTVSTAARLSRVLLLEQAHQAADPAQDDGTGGVRLEGPGPAGMSEPGGVLAEDPADGRAGTLQEDQHQVTVPWPAGGVDDQLFLGLADGGELAPL